MNDLTQTPEMLIATMGARARKASAELAGVDSASKAKALHHAADAIRARAAQIIDANARDMENAAANGLSPAMLDRLKLDDKRVAAMADGVDQVARLTLDTDPVGQVIDRAQRPN